MLLEDYDKKNLFDGEHFLKNRDKAKLTSKSKVLKIKYKKLIIGLNIATNDRQLKLYRLFYTQN